jgi:hypothetical protein
MSEELDFDSRELCPDGACTGVIGEDGRCRVCGLSGSGKSESEPASASASESESQSAPDSVSAPDSASAPDPDFDDRRLCPDGACTGLIGPDGRCKECGCSADAS